jgi:hypothetical protein
VYCPQLAPFMCDHMLTQCDGAGIHGWLVDHLTLLVDEQTGSLMPNSMLAPQCWTQQVLLSFLPPFILKQHSRWCVFLQRTWPPFGLLLLVTHAGIPSVGIMQAHCKGSCPCHRPTMQPWWTCPSS